MPEKNNSTVSRSVLMSATEVRVLRMVPIPKGFLGLVGSRAGIFSALAVQIQVNSILGVESFPVIVASDVGK